MDNHPLRGPLLKVKRARAHIELIQQEANNYLSAINVVMRVEARPPTTNDRVLVVKADKPVTVPDNIYSLIAEHVYHLRSALDQMCVAVGQANSANDTNRIHFPFAGDKKEYQAKGTQRKIDQLPTDVQQMLAELKPYKGGDDVLWALSRLSNIDKHNGLVSVGNAAAVTSMAFSSLTMENCSGGFFGGGGLFDLNRGLVLIDMGPDGSVKIGRAQINAEIMLAFGDVDVFAGQPVLGVLHHLTDKVERIIETFEAHSFGH